MDFVQNVHQAHISMNKENANLLMINVKRMIREMGDVYLVIMLLNLQIRNVFKIMDMYLKIQTVNNGYKDIV